MSPDLYRLTTKVLALPLAACWAFACWLIARDHELLGAGLLMASSAAAVLTAHWLGWRRGTVIVDGRHVDAPARKRNTASSSSPRLSLVGALALMLAIATGCPPGDDETTPPDAEGATTDQTDPAPDPAAQDT